MTGQMPTQPHMQVTRQGAIAVLTIDRPPVNALAQAHPMITAGEATQAEGMERRSVNIDVIWVNGNGFPRELGGPIYWKAHQRGRLAK